MLPPSPWPRAASPSPARARRARRDRRARPASASTIASNTSCASSTSSASSTRPTAGLQVVRALALGGRGDRRRHQHDAEIGVAVDRLARRGDRPAHALADPRARAARSSPCVTSALTSKSPTRHAVPVGEIVHVAGLRRPQLVEAGAAGRPRAMSSAAMLTRAPCSRRATGLQRAAEALGQRIGDIDAPRPSAGPTTPASSSPPARRRAVARRAGCRRRRRPRRPPRAAAAARLGKLAVERRRRSACRPA